MSVIPENVAHIVERLNEHKKITQIETKVTKEDGKATISCKSDVCDFEVFVDPMGATVPFVELRIYHRVQCEYTPPNGVWCSGKAFFDYHDNFRFHGNFVWDISAEDECLDWLFDYIRTESLNSKIEVVNVKR